MATSCGRPFIRAAFALAITLICLALTHAARGQEAKGGPGAKPSVIATINLTSVIPRCSLKTQLEAPFQPELQRLQQRASAMREELDGSKLPSGGTFMNRRSREKQREKLEQDCEAAAKEFQESFNAATGAVLNRMRRIINARMGDYCSRRGIDMVFQAGGESPSGAAPCGAKAAEEIARLGIVWASSSRDVSEDFLQYLEEWAASPKPTKILLVFSGVKDEMGLAVAVQKAIDAGPDECALLSALSEEQKALAIGIPPDQQEAKRLAQLPFDCVVWIGVNILSNEQMQADLTTLDVRTGNVRYLEAVRRDKQADAPVTVFSFALVANILCGIETVP
ncbi:MAG TPA: OmpH family outer membrane protein [Candidatus Brocadiia bacterium]|nr:OmpH family outer membrane protein [Candidatus Brocadiia bacterium]